MLKSKSFYVSVVSVLCAIAVVGITSMAINSGGNNKTEEEKSYLEDDNNGDKVEEFDISEEMGEDTEGDGQDLNKTEEVLQNQPSVPDNKDQVDNDLAQDNVSADVKKDEKAEEKTPEKNVEKADGTKKPGKDAQPVLADKGLIFNEEKGLAWPINGDVIMEFSENGMVYYKTLGQFMRSDKILIGAAVGDKVKACATGVITDVTTTRETGKTVTMSIGSGYSVIYGELDNITVKKGEKVKSGQIIGTVSMPSGYYSKEGTNLYFKVVENEVPVNPMYLLK